MNLIDNISIILKIVSKLQMLYFFSCNSCTKLDPVGSTVRDEMRKLCTGSVLHTMRQWQLVIDDTRSVEDILAFIYCKKWRFGQVLPMPDSLTHSLTDFERYDYSAP